MYNVLKYWKKWWNIDKNKFTVTGVQPHRNRKYFQFNNAHDCKHIHLMYFCNDSDYVAVCFVCGISCIIHTLALTHFNTDISKLCCVIYTLVTRESEWARMHFEWKFEVHSVHIEVHSKHSYCIPSAFRTFGPIRRARSNVFNMFKTFEVHSKWKNIERQSKCIRTAF